MEDEKRLDIMAGEAGPQGCFGRPVTPEELKIMNRTASAAAEHLDQAIKRLLHMDCQRGCVHMEHQNARMLAIAAEFMLLGGKLAGFLVHDGLDQDSVLRTLAEAQVAGYNVGLMDDTGNTPKPQEKMQSDPPPAAPKKPRKIRRKRDRRKS